MANKRIMVLGAGRGQVDLIKAIKKYGHTAIVASVDGNYPGFKYADEICYVDITDEKSVCQKALELRIDAITTACLDTGIAALGYTCSTLNISGLSKEAAKLSNDKFLMKDAFVKHNVNTARYKKVLLNDDVLSVTADLNYPLIVKAVDLQGSRGINIVNTKDELVAAFNDTMSETRKDFCIIEEFIKGYEFGAQAFVVDGEVLYVLPCGDITYLSKTNIPIGHYAPLQFEDSVMQSVIEEVKKAIEALGLNNCAVNIDMILKDDKVYLIELTGRIGANCLPQLSSIYLGFDVYKLIIDAALGINPKEFYEKNLKSPTPCYARMLYSEKSGVLKEIINKNKENENVYEVSFFVSGGDEVNKFYNSKDCLGEVVVKGNTLKECEELISEVIANIEFVLE